MALLGHTLLGALAVASTAYAGSIADIEHVVLFMQENRAFDHYFGTMVEKHLAAYKVGQMLKPTRLVFVGSKTRMFR